MLAETTLGQSVSGRTSSSSATAISTASISAALAEPSPRLESSEMITVPGQTIASSAASIAATRSAPAPCAARHPMTTARISSGRGAATLASAIVGAAESA
jgi:hypothetical protein